MGAVVRATGGGPINNRPFSCDGKEDYPSLALAQRVAKRRRQKKAGRLTAYVCAVCGGIHIGGDPLRVRLKRSDVG